MKQLSSVVLILAILLLASKSLKADQLAWITESQAKQATELLKTQNKIILYCACCDNDPKQKVKIKNVVYRHPKINGKEQKEYYQVFVTAKINGEWQEVALDLAYVHIKKGKEAHCLGKELNFECDPCTEPFSWKT